MCGRYHFSSKECKEIQQIAPVMAGRDISINHFMEIYINR